MYNNNQTKRYKHLIFAVTIASFAVICMQSCTSSNSKESDGYEWLAKARAQLADKNHKEARNSIDSLRKNCPMAFNAREEGILLLDSIEISQARQDLDNATASIDSGNADKDSMLFVKEESAKNKVLYQETYSRQKQFQKAQAIARLPQYELFL